MPLAVSINPHKLALYYKSNGGENLGYSAPRIMPSSTKRKNNGELSKKARNRIRTALNWLVSCSAKRNVKLQDGTYIPNFQISFITLTLPTKQMHSHSEIKSRCLNLFLQNLRNKFGVKNYVWKAELQKNGNIHFHLSIDKPIHYMIIRKYWNAAIAKLGYIKQYSETFGLMDFEEYFYWSNQNGQNDRTKAKNAFHYGCATGWKSPNTTDVKAVKSVENWASYMSKYMAKDSGDKEKTGVYADSLSELTGRIWYCSESISKLGNVKFDFNPKIHRIISQIRKCPKVFKFDSDWCQCLYFKIKDLNASVRKFLREELLFYVMKTGYAFPDRYPVW